MPLFDVRPVYSQSTGREGVERGVFSSSATYRTAICDDVLDIDPFLLHLRVSGVGYDVYKYDAGSSKTSWSTCGVAFVQLLHHFPYSLILSR